MGESAGMPPAGAPSSGASDSRGTMAGSQRSNSGSPSSSYPSNAPSQMGAAGSEAPAGAVLDPHSQGVVGMKGIQLNSSGEGSVVSSADNNVHLDRGTQLVLRTESRKQADWD